MASSSPKVWAQKNKRLFAKKMIKDSSVVTHSEPAAFFMAGLPGAGKTEFTKNLIKDLNLKVVRIDMDEIATHIEAYDPLHADAFREAASDLLNAVYDKTLTAKVDFIMDGTFRSHNSIKNIQRALRKGYVVKVLYILQDPAVAWEFTQARERVEHRAISKQGFIDGYFAINDNIKELSGARYSDVTIDAVVKDVSNRVGQWRENISSTGIDSLVNVNYTKDELERTLNQ